MLNFVRKSEITRTFTKMGSKNNKKNDGRKEETKKDYVERIDHKICSKEFFKLKSVRYKK